MPWPILPSRSPQPLQADIGAPKSACRPPANLPSTRIRARIIAPVTPLPPSPVLAPSIGGFGLSRRPEKDEDAVREVRNHFFAVGNRALIRDNAVSKLWWLGKIAHDIDPANPREFLTILLHRQDMRSALIERPSVSTNRRVLRGIYEVMREHWSDGGALFARKAFRSWMSALNRRGRVVLLDALPEEALGQLLREEARRAVEGHSQQT